jgi:signal transduction histidine kinase/ligand-binding sensor domain-containing protein
MHFLQRETAHYLSKPLFLSLGAILLCMPVYGLDRDRTIMQLYHTAWTAKEGAPRQIKALAQTNDGYLWLGSPTGLYRFDGVLFDRYEPRSGGPFPSNNIFTLVASPDGGLWIGFWYGGISFLKDGDLTNYGEPEGLPTGRVQGITRDDEGTIWAATGGGLARLERGRWRRIGMEWNYPGKAAQSVLVDRKGTLWVTTEKTIVFLLKGAKSFQLTQEWVEQVLQMAESQDGSVWVAETTRAVRQVTLPGIDPKLLGPEVRVGSIGFLFDREGALWATSIGNGIRRVPFPDRYRGKTIEKLSNDAEIFTEKDGLSADYVTAILEDHEGNIWIGTGSGLDRFRESNLVSVRFPSAYQDFGLAAGDGGDIWTISLNRKSNRIRGDTPAGIGPTMGFSSIFRDEEGTIWMATTEAIVCFRGDKYSSLKTPSGDNFSPVSIIFKDRTGVLWVYLEQQGAFLLKNGVWARYDRQAELPKSSPIIGFLDSADRKWFGYPGNILTVIDGNNIRTFSRDNGLLVGDIKAICALSLHVWVGGESGLAVLEGNRFRMLIANDADAFNGISGIVAATDGALWLNGGRGIVHIPAEEVGLALKNPAHRVRYRLFDFLDGLQGTAQQRKPFPTAVEGSDGRVWFATNKGVAWIDPKHILKNTLPPPVSIRSLDTEARKYETSVPLILPPGTTNLRIEYTALSLSMPERVRFRYKLEGIDKDWQDAETRRQAFYNSLRPGTYSFQVIACNNDGIWNEQGALLAFSVAPAWYQTNWFRLLSFITGLFALWVLYRLRLRKIATAMSTLFDERLAERTRIARELHDTLLQTIQGSKMVADDALEQSADPVRLRRAVEQLSNWLGQAVNEGRAALNSLRSSTTEKNDLAEALQRAIETCRILGSVLPTFTKAGNSREMHPIVRDEVYRIGYEAIRNACMHSGGTHLDVELRYGHDLVVRVKDDGQGIAATIIAEGKEGHFGLHGMRERAVRIGAKLTIVSTANSGTEIVLMVPGDIAFRISTQPD